MKKSDFYYDLPQQLIARYPTQQRSASQLLYVNRQSGRLQHHQQFNAVLDYLQPNDLLVFNNSKVIPARLHGKKETGGRVELFVEKICDDEEHAYCFAQANRTPRIPSEIKITEAHQVTLVQSKDDLVLARFPYPVLAFLHDHGEMPIPPYLQRRAEAIDQTRYQTVFAEHEGAVAAPTAGLHFDASLLEQIKQKGIQQAFITLHVGAGTFQPVRAEKIEDHQMHAEYLEVSKQVCEQIKRTQQQDGRVIAVGTTVVRSLETAAQQGEIQPFQGESNIFIYPGFYFQCIDGMITNFHLPESTLLMLVAAFAGLEKTMSAYHEAVQQNYRFYSYGDAMLIL